MRINGFTRERRKHFRLMIVDWRTTRFSGVECQGAT